MKLLMKYLGCLVFLFALNFQGFILATPTFDKTTIETEAQVELSILDSDLFIQGETALPACLEEKVAEKLETTNFKTAFIQQTSEKAYVFSYIISPEQKGYIKTSDLTCDAEITIGSDLEGL